MGQLAYGYFTYYLTYWALTGGGYWEGCGPTGRGQGTVPVQGRRPVLCVCGRFPLVIAMCGRISMVLVSISFGWFWIAFASSHHGSPPTEPIFYVP